MNMAMANQHQHQFIFHILLFPENLSVSRLVGYDRQLRAAIHFNETKKNDMKNYIIGKIS